MESVKDFEKDSSEPGDLSKKNTRNELPKAVQPAITPPDSSRSTSKPSLQRSLQELQLMVGPETLRLCEGLDNLNVAVERGDLQQIMVAIQKIKAAASALTKSCTTIESKLFELQDPTWSTLLQ